MKKIKGIKGKFIISSVGTFDGDKVKSFKELWYKSNNFKIIESTPKFTTRAGFIDMNTVEFNPLSSDCDKSKKNLN